MNKPVESLHQFGNIAYWSDNIVSHLINEVVLPSIRKKSLEPVAEKIVDFAIEHLDYVSVEELTEQQIADMYINGHTAAIYGDSKGIHVPDPESWLEPDTATQFESEIVSKLTTKALEIERSFAAGIPQIRASQEFEAEQRMAEEYENEQRANLKKRESEYLRRKDEDYDNYEASEHERLLHKHDITTLPIHKNLKELNSQIGTGAFGAVYHGFWNGRECAVKVTKHESEFAAAKKMQSYRKSAPGWIKKHLPEIYEVKVLNGEGFVIIMELLQPAPNEVLEGLFSLSRIPANYAKGNAPLRAAATLLQNPAYMEKLLKDSLSHGANMYIADSAILSFMTSNRDAINEKITAGVLSEWFKMRAPKTFDGVADAIEQILQRSEAIIYNAAVKIASEGLPSDKFDIFKHTILPMLVLRKKDQLYDGFSSVTSTPMIQTMHDDEQPLGIEVSELTPEAISLKRVLDHLVSTGILWGDLHGQNVMVRPSTRDIVLIDFGLYDFIE